MTRRTILVIRICIAVGLLATMLYIVKPPVIWNALKSARFDLLALGIALMPLNIGLQEVKWRYLVKLVRPEATVGETVGSLFGGFAFGIVTPGRIGEYGRGLFIHDTPSLKLVGLTVIDKFYNLGCTIAFGLPALLTLPWVLKLFEGYMLVSLIILLFVINVTLLYLALDPRPVKSLLYAAQIMLPRKDRIAQLAGGLDLFSSPQARVTLILTLLHYMVFLLQYFVFLNGFASLDPLSSFRVAAAVLFSKSALPISIGGLGFDQLVSVQFASQFQVSTEAAFNTSLLLFAVNVLVPALIGVLFISRLQLGKTKNRNKR